MDLTSTQVTIGGLIGLAVGMIPIFNHFKKMREDAAQKESELTSIRVGQKISSEEIKDIKVDIKELTARMEAKHDKLEENLFNEVKEIRIEIKELNSNLIMAFNRMSK